MISILAYAGPGAGLSAIGALLALLGGILIAIVGFVWYPMKRLLARRKKEQANPKDETTAQDETSDDPS